jgi:hypothetical protein
MIKFSTRILKFGNKGEKTGWRYIEISKQQAEKLNAGCKVSFRIKGKLDNHVIEKAALLPMGDGNFILPINASIRKAIAKEEGDLMQVQMEHDKRELTLSSDFIQCLKDEPGAYDFFKTLPKSHQAYFSKWIDSAKTMTTKAKRITMAVIALAKKLGFGEMIRANKGNR